jgi:hypothetical protein
MMKRLSEVACQQQDLADQHGSIDLTLRMSEQPDQPLDTLVPAEHLAAFGISAEQLDLITSGAGSWVEIWNMSLAAFGAVHLTLATLDTTWEHIAHLLKDAKVTGRFVGLERRSTPIRPVDQVTPDGGAEMKAAGPPVSIDLPTLAAAVEQVAAESRVVTDADRRALQRMDIAVRRLSAANDENVSMLLQYAAPNVKEVRIIFN